VLARVYDTLNLAAAWAVLPLDGAVMLVMLKSWARAAAGRRRQRAKAAAGAI